MIKHLDKYHDKLMQSSSGYKSWHEGDKYHIKNWILFGVTVLVTFFLINNTIKNIELSFVSAQTSTSIVSAQASGSISASPNPCIINTGSNACTSTISWTFSNTALTQINVSTDGGTGSYFSCGNQLSSQAPWIGLNTTYIFKLYAVSACGDNAALGSLLSQISVTGVAGISTRPPLYEPADGNAYFGFLVRTWDSTDPGDGDTRNFSTRYSDSIQYELGGKYPTLMYLPAIWQNNDGTMNNFSNELREITKFNNFNDHTVNPFIRWNAQTGWGNTDPVYKGINTKTINQGSLDAYIHQYAKDVKAYGKPIFINPICGEFNGNYAYNCSPLADTNLTKQDFISAWQRIVNIFNQEGVTNVAWVWNPNTFPPPPTNWGFDTDLTSYYPGDNYVDWVGADHYDYGSPSWMDPQYNFAVAHNKPFFLGEWGVRHSASNLTPVQAEKWLNDMFTYFESHPKIKAILYFNYNMNGPAQWDYTNQSKYTWLYNKQVNYLSNVNNFDHRLLAESGANFRATFATRISNPRYTSNLFGVISSPSPQPSTQKLKIGDRVKTTSKLNVRATPGGKRVGAQVKNSFGTIVSGPQTTTRDTWWNINYDNAPDGWSAENWLEK